MADNPPAATGVPNPGTSSTAASCYDPKSDPSRRAKSNDPGWKYGFWPDLKDKN